LHFNLSVTSSGNAEIFSYVFESSFNNSSLLAETATFQPLLANLIAKALPIPVLPPVIQIVFFAHFLICINSMIKNKLLTFILFLIITFSASLVGGLATINFKEPWYSLLNKPIFNPPDWVFGPVWTILYLMMTISIWLYWHSKNKEMNTVYIYFIHLVFNTTWSITFFVFHNMLLALVVLIILIAFIINLILSFRRVKKVSAYLMIPYLLWCCFALILNSSLIILN
jgi:tryptophan-rich sensory protein